MEELGCSLTMSSIHMEQFLQRHEPGLHCQVVKGYIHFEPRGRSRYQQRCSRKGTWLVSGASVTLLL